LSIIITVEVKLAEAHLGSCNGYESVNPRKEQSKDSQDLEWAHEKSNANEDILFLEAIHLLNVLKVFFSLLVVEVSHGHIHARIKDLFAYVGGM
jgi:hypothetical protein